MVANYYLRTLYKSTLLWNPDGWPTVAERAEQVHRQQTGQNYAALMAEWQRLCDAFPIQTRILGDYLQELDHMDSSELIPEGCRLFARALEVQPDHLGLALCYARYLRSSISREDHEAESKLSRLYEEYAEYRNLLDDEDDMPETEDVDEE